MNLPPYATDMDYIRCEKIVKRILGDEENVNVQELTLEIMGISEAKGGGYSATYLWLLPKHISMKY